MENMLLKTIKMILSSSNQEVTNTPPPINKHSGCVHVCREHTDSFEAYYFY